MPSAPRCAPSAPCSVRSPPPRPWSPRTRSRPCSPAAEPSAGGPTVPAMTAPAPDPTMARVAEAMELGQQGRPAEARELFAAIWADLGPDGDPLHRVAVAHAMADLQDDPHDELAWDLRALEAVEGLSDERAAAAGVTSPVAAFYPSLHLNLGEDYRKLGDPEAARRHLDLGLAAAGTLPDDGYGAMIRGGLEGLAARLAEARD